MIKKQGEATKGTLSLLCRQLVLEADQPFDYTLDGELYVSRANTLAISMGPELEFVAL
jgi:hypothetical protein